MTNLFQDADDALFRKILYNKTHILHTYLPEQLELVCSLRSRNHSKSLIDTTNDLNDRYFLIRAL